MYVQVVMLSTFHLPVECLLLLHTTVHYTGLYYNVWINIFCSNRIHSASDWAEDCTGEEVGRATQRSHGIKDYETVRCIFDVK